MQLPYNCVEINQHAWCGHGFEMAHPTIAHNGTGHSLTNAERQRIWRKRHRGGATGNKTLMAHDR